MPSHRFFAARQAAKPCRERVRLLLTAAIVFAALLAATAGPVQSGDLAVHSDFPGGSAHVDGIDQQGRVLRVQPADHPGRGWRCWWYFKVTGIRPGEMLTLTVSGGGFALPDRAAFSLDDATWKHTSPGRREKGKVTYTVRAGAREAWFAWGPPYLPCHASELIARAEKACPRVKAFDLCRTRQNRPVPALRFSPPEAAGARPFGVWVQARQHAWESGSSWVCDGLVEWLVSSDPRAKSLRQRAAVTVVPIMDIDNVAGGAGGKNQKPQDHNRDWTDRPHWRSVAAAQKLINDMAVATRFALFVDLHNPGPRDRDPFFYICPRNLLTPLQQTRLDAFLAVARVKITGPLTFTGRTRECGANYDKNWKAISKNWVHEHVGGAAVAVTLETSWNTPTSTQENYRRVGRELGLAIEQFLRRLAGAGTSAD